MMRKIASVVALSVALFTGGVAYGAADIPDDAALFNCHVHGNQRCGDTPGPVGFSNADELNPFTYVYKIKAKVF